MCDCKSYNRPDLGGSRDPKLMPNGTEVDRCIAKQIQALWEYGVETLASRCSHGGELGPAPSVVLSRAGQAGLAKEILNMTDPDRRWQIVCWS